MSEKKNPRGNCGCTHDFKSLMKDITSIKKALVGDVDEPEAEGVIERVRTLERTAERRKWFDRAVVTSLLGLIGKMFKGVV